MRPWPLWIFLTLPALAAGCGGGLADEGAFPPSTVDAPDGIPQCFSSSECPVGFVCSEFGTCVAPPPPPTDGGVTTPPPEIEYRLTEPSSSRHFVWVAMTD